MTDQRPEVLIQLGAELERVARRTLSRPSRPRQAVLLAARPAALAILATAACLVAVLIALAGSAHKTPAPSRVGPLGQGSLEASFVVLRRPAKPGDGLPSSALRILEPGGAYQGAYREFGLETKSSRRVITTASVTVWLVPGRNGVCLLGQIPHRQGPVTQAGCSTKHRAENDGTISPFGDTVTGVLPDGSSNVAVRAGGETTKLSLIDGAFAFRHPPGHGPLNVYYTDSSGQRRHIDLIPTSYRLGRSLGSRR